jgi:hypothetical protein
MIVDDYVLTYKHKIEDKRKLHLLLKTEVKINNKTETLENAIRNYIKSCLNFLENEENESIFCIQDYEFKI